jgi:hypothetical protein
MTHGIDTGFLVAAEIREHPFHREANALLHGLLTEGHERARPGHQGLPKRFGEAEVFEGVDTCLRRITCVNGIVFPSGNHPARR